MKQLFLLLAIICLLALGFTLLHWTSSDKPVSQYLYIGLIVTELGLMRICQAQHNHIDSQEVDEVEYEEPEYQE